MTPRESLQFFSTRYDRFREIRDLHDPSPSDEMHAIGTIEDWRALAESYGRYVAGYVRAAIAEPDDRRFSNIVGQAVAHMRLAYRCARETRVRLARGWALKSRRYDLAGGFNSPPDRQSPLYVVWTEQAELAAEGAGSCGMP